MALTELSSVSVSPRGLGRDDDLSIVWLRGEHDIATVPKLAKTLSWSIALDDANLVIDLSGVQFMGADTVGAIVSARNALRLQSRSLSLRSPSTRARRVIEVCGLSNLIDLPPEATAEVKAARALENELLDRRLQNALDSRVFIERAKGVIAEREDIDIEKAFVAMQHHARTHDLRVVDVAHRVLAGTLVLSALVAAEPAGRREPLRSA